MDGGAVSGSGRGSGRRFPRRGTGLAPGEGVPDHVARRFDPNAYAAVPAWSRDPVISAKPHAYDPKAHAAALAQSSASAPAASPAPAPATPHVLGQPERRAQLRRRGAARYSTVCLFGPPDGSAEALATVLGRASNSVSVLVPDFGDLQDQVAALQANFPDRMVIIVGVPLSEDALQGVWDMRLAAPPDGVLVEVQVPFGIAAASGTTEAAYRQYEEERAKMSERIRALNAEVLGLPYDGRLEPSLIQLCELLGIED